ncbi:sensor histidine kinase [Paenibacillus soyae]|uniref:Heme sensor protein HssS n=1 Tax=Paenibacillus soyae TaxID=2969249 RepID=A0A9X2MT65_9BACL|nr:ATP-binding protein [Paenibacillus soyae]MCR2806364.1 ATP-binding protein [Paenibacillus soyae]
MKLKSSLYVKYLVVALLIMSVSTVLAFLATNMYYQQVLKEQNDAKNTAIASRMAAYISGQSKLNLQEHLSMLGQAGYQIYVVNESGASGYYGGEYRRKELERSIIADVLAGDVYHGMRDYRKQLFVTGFFANDIRNSIGIPFVHEGQRYAMFVRPDIRLLFSEVHTMMGGMALLMLVVSLLAIIIAAWYLVRPIKKLTAATRRIAAEDFETHVRISRSDELGELAASFNRMAKQLLANEAERKSFIRNVSHDFQSPLLNIGGYAALLKQKELDEASRRQYAAVIENEAMRLSNLTKQLLLLTSLDQRGKSITRRSYALHEQIERIVMKYRWLLEKEEISISLDTDPLYLNGDEALLENVWENLLTNAIKYNKPGGKIRIRTERERKQVNVTFEDTGIGIAEQDLPHVFERFYRADASRSTNGTGLGLSIVKETVVLHQGEIRISSTRGEGTCVTVTLPIMPGADRLDTV